MSDTPQPVHKHNAADPAPATGVTGTPERGGTHVGGLPLHLTGLIGRERELAEVEGLLSEDRLITLTGPGGSGKTRLASAVASAVAGRFEDGAWWVGLAPVSDPELVPQAVAQVLRVSEAPNRTLTQAVAEDLSELEILLVLDNCEHLVGACATLARALLEACPGLVILATSREALGVAGERSKPVPPLSLPDPAQPQPTVEELVHYDAIDLFVERARAVVPSFELTEENAAIVVRVCRGLDGLPLAIELAAARIRVLSVEQISSRLENSFGLLSGGRTAPPRQRTLAAAMDWSYELLSQEEKVLFRRLSVFAGRFTLDAAEGVCPGESLERGDVLDLLALLVDKSLVLFAEQSGEARYGLLETIRQYARHKLEESGEAGRVRRRHAEYYLALAEEAGPGLVGTEQAEWMGRLEQENGNLRAALETTMEGQDAGTGLRLAVALEWFWWTRGDLGEGRRWLEWGLANSGASPTVARTRALNEAGWMALWQDNLDRSVQLLEEGLGSFRKLGDERGVATSLANLGHAFLHQHDRAQLAVLGSDAESLRKGFTDPWASAELLVFLGMAALYLGDHERATTLLGEGRISFQELRDTQRAGLCLTYLWMATLEAGEPGRAATLLRENLRRSLGQKVLPQLQTYDDLMGSAAVAVLEGRAARSARLLGAAETLRVTINLSLLLWDHAPTDYDGLFAAMRSRLGEAAWGEAWTQGRSMAPEEAVEYALEADEPTLAPEEAVASSSLSGRETEVLKLVAEGLTNPQIAGRLYLSPRTVGQHLRSIYRKLGIHSRAAAAREAVEQDLI